MHLEPSIWFSVAFYCLCLAGAIWLCRRARIS